MGLPFNIYIKKMQNKSNLKTEHSQPQYCTLLEVNAVNCMPGTVKQNLQQLIMYYYLNQALDKVFYYEM